MKVVNRIILSDLAIGIKDHQAIFKKGYGKTSRLGGRAVDIQTVFPISSCTKAYVFS